MHGWTGATKTLNCSISACSCIATGHNIDRCICPPSLFPAQRGGKNQAKDTQIQVHVCTFGSSLTSHIELLHQSHKCIAELEVKT